MKVSRWFWRWLKAAHAAVKSREDIAGITLQRVHLCAKFCPNMNGGPVRVTSVFFGGGLWSEVNTTGRGELFVPPAWDVGLQPGDWELDEIHRVCRGHAEAW